MNPHFAAIGNSIYIGHQCSMRGSYTFTLWGTRLGSWTILLVIWIFGSERRSVHKLHLCVLTAEFVDSHKRRREEGTLTLHFVWIHVERIETNDVGRRIELLGEERERKDTCSTPKQGFQERSLRLRGHIMMNPSMMSCTLAAVESTGANWGAKY